MRAFAGSGWHYHFEGRWIGHVGRHQVERAIRNAFAGATLGRGVSLRQAEAIDAGTLETDEDLRTVRAGEVVDDWSRVARAELDRDCVAHLDAEGLRYYLPALMLSLLDDYDHTSMRVIGTLAALYPKAASLKSDVELYDALTLEQRKAVALFLTALPQPGRPRPRRREGGGARPTKLLAAVHRNVSTLFVIEDEAHAEPHGEFDALESAVAELRRRAEIAWDRAPNLAPCVEWKTCGRRYEIVEYDRMLGHESFGRRAKGWVALRSARPEILDHIPDYHPGASVEECRAASVRLQNVVGT